MSRTTLAGHLRRRRAAAGQEAELRTNEALYDASRALRREAQVYLNAGRPDLAEPYLAEARLFEGATSPVEGL